VFCWWNAVVHACEKTTHAGAYRLAKNIGTLQDLARIVSAPAEWEATVAALQANPFLLCGLRRLQGMTRASGAAFETELLRFCGKVAVALHRDINVTTRDHVVVGGCLAEAHYDFKCATGPVIRSKSNNKPIFAVEVKPAAEFTGTERWYHKNRGTRVLATMWGFCVPVILVSPVAWKLVLIGPGGQGVFVMPFAAWNSTSGCGSMGPEFLAVLALCLLGEGSV
jgi:hypothetical protein